MQVRNTDMRGLPPVFPDMALCHLNQLGSGLFFLSFFNLLNIGMRHKALNSGAVASKKFMLAPILRACF
jgi:hypothetical protein